ncbi:MAG: flagellar basal body P-ring protein FlgI [Myxococcales bacterium]|nr:flagellar basal body P-ring protein FlgI [Myxococcales bacterium]
MAPLYGCLLLVLSSPAEAARVKDFASVYGIHDDPLVGYGLVVGLNKSGDSSQNIGTIRALEARLPPLGISLQDDAIKSRNVAMVMISARLPAGARSGSKLDVTVMSVADAKSLEGGVLLLTELHAGNEVYAIAEGPLTVGGYSVSGGGNESTRNHPTVGVIPGGASVSREVPNRLRVTEQVAFDWILHDPDFTNSARVASVVNALLGPETARAMNSGTITVHVPDDYLGRQAEFIATVEALDVQLDHVLRVVVNERTGTVVMGADIPLSPVAIAHGGLTIDVSRQTQVSQPGMLAAGETTTVTNTEVRVREDAGKLVLVKGATVGDVVSALNAMGVTPRDLIVILQSMRRAGGLHAEVVSM